MTQISLSSLLARGLFFSGLLLLLLVSSWFITRTAVSDRLVMITRGENEYDPATKLASMDAAVQFAPQMANAHFQRGQAYLAQALGEETTARLQEAITSFRTAAQLSPEDYRIRLALAQTQERAGQDSEARQSFAQTLALAPNYYQSHWAYGNYLLRNSETEAAFAQFKQALSIRPTQLPLLFDYAWNTFNGDVALITKTLAPPLAAQAGFATLLLTRGKLSEGLTMWRELQQKAPALARTQARDFIQTLLNKQQFGPAYELWRDTAQFPHPDEANLTEQARQEEVNWYTVHQPDPGSLLSNGDFERDLRTDTVAPFLIWRLTQTKGLTISRNNQHRKQGEYSLQLNFDVTGNVGFPVVDQLLPLKPGTNYRLSFAVKIEDLQTLSAPLVEVYDPVDLKRLHVSTKPFPLGTSAWQEYSLDFTTGTATEAVTVRLLRPACGEPPCPVRGRIWLDNFRLEQK